MLLTWTALEARHFGVYHNVSSQAGGYPDNKVRMRVFPPIRDGKITQPGAVRFRCKPINSLLFSQIVERIASWLIACT